VVTYIFFINLKYYSKEGKKMTGVIRATIVIIVVVYLMMFDRISKKERMRK